MSTLYPNLPLPVTAPPMRAWLTAVVVIGGIAIAISPGGFGAAFFMALVAAGIAAIGFFPREDRSALLAAYVVALVLRLVAMVILFLWFQTPENPEGFLYPDSFGYHRMGTAIAGLIEKGLPFRLAYHTTGSGLGYHQTVAYMYAIFGASPWVPRIFNCVLGTLSILLVYVFARPLGGRRVAVGSAWMLALWPTAIWWSVQMLKDMPVAFLVILSAACWVRFLVTRRWIYILLYILATLPLFKLRIYCFAFQVGGLYVGLMVDVLRRRQFLFATALVLAAVFGWSIPFKTGMVDPPALMLWKLSQNNPLVAGSLVSSLAKSGAGISVVMPLAIIKFVLSPLPWKAAGKEIMVVPGVMMQHMLLPFAVRGGYMLLRHRFRFVIQPVLLTVLTGLIYAIVFLGANPRHMQMFYPFLFVCALVGMQGWRHWVLPWCLFFTGMTLVGLGMLGVRAGIW